MLAYCAPLSMYTRIPLWTAQEINCATKTYTHSRTQQLAKMKTGYRRSGIILINPKFCIFVLKKWQLSQGNVYHLLWWQGPSDKFSQMSLSFGMQAICQIFYYVNIRKNEEKQLTVSLRVERRIIEWQYKHKNWRLWTQWGRKHPKCSKNQHKKVWQEASLLVSDT